MKVISVVGTKKTGKTTLVAALVRSLARYGRVGTVKNMPGHPIDTGDTRRHFEAGADVTIGVGDNLLKVTRGRFSLDYALVDLYRSGMDFAVVEGFKNSRLPKIVLGEIEVPCAIKDFRIQDLNEVTLKELTDVVIGLKDYDPDKNNCQGEL